MKIIIAGDLFIADEFEISNLIDKSVIEIFKNAEYRIVNLEAPITSNISSNKIIKTGPHLRMSEKNVIGLLKQLNVDSVTMANNHVLDYGVQGLNDTFEVLDKTDISYVGAGKNLNDAAKPLIVEKNNVKVAIVNFCENEWSIADAYNSGANPMNIIDNTSQIKEARKLADYVIVIVHGGHEYYNLPSPRMQKQYRFYADQGADIVVGHHTHCISGYEEHNGIPIYYSLGNFLFTMNNFNDEWYTGLILELELQNGDIKHCIHPVQQRKGSFRLSNLDEVETKKIKNRVDEYSKILQDTEKLYDNWYKYISKQRHRYLNYWSPLSHIKNRYLRKILRLFGGYYLSERGLSLYLNLIRCEAHRDVAMEVIAKSITHEIN